MSKGKLEQVLEYLMNDQEDQAKALIHEIFLEKARAIHESMMEDDEELGGDEEDGFKREVGGDSNATKDFEEFDDEIEDEEVNLESEENDDEFYSDDESAGMDDDMEMDSDDMEMSDEDGDMDGEYGEINDKIEDLEHALDALKAAFSEINDEDEDDMTDVDMADEEVEHEEDEEVEHSEMDDDEFEDMLESLNLEVYDADIYKSGKAVGEVGAGKYSKVKGASESPVPKSQTSRNGAGPVKFDRGSKVSGYPEWEDRVGYDKAAAKELKHGGDNRRKRAESGMEDIEGAKYGQTKKMGSKIESTKSEFNIKDNSASPFTKTRKM